MNIRTIISASIFSFLVTGCGGGGGSSDSPSTVAEIPSSPPSATTESAPQPGGDRQPVTATNELTAEADFALDSSLDIAVDINLKGLDNEAAYLSICGARSDATPDYDNCFVRTALPEAAYEGTLRLSSALEDAYSAIWFLDMSHPAIITKHDLETGVIALQL